MKTKKAFFYIYVTTNLVNGKKYIGQHCTYDMDDGYLGSSLELLKDVELYSKENFKRKIIEHCDNIFHLADRELFWIKKTKAVEDPMYYNTSYFCAPNYAFAYGLKESTKRKISKAKTGKKYPNRRSLTEEERKNISERMKGNKNATNKDNGPYPKMGHRKGTKWTEEQKTNLSISISGAGNPFFGKKHTQESKDKISKTLKGRPRSPEAVAKSAAGCRARNLKRERVICEHCGKDVAINIYYLFHGEKCKHKIC